MAGRILVNEIKLLHGEALRVLRDMDDETIDLVIADPPYSSGGQYRGDRMQSTHTKYVQTDTIADRPDFAGDNRDQRSYLAWSTLWLSECLRLLKPGRLCLVFTDWRQLPTTTDALQAGGFIWRGIIAWDKTEAARPILGFSAQAEYLVWGSRGPIDLGVNVYLNGVLRAATPRGDARIHQTEKPLGLLEQLVAVAPPGGLVLDPFAGSGTTLAAALNRGRRGIGIEIDGDWVERAGIRLAQTSIGDITLKEPA